MSRAPCLSRHVRAGKTRGRARWWELAAARFPKATFVRRYRQSFAS